MEAANRDHIGILALALLSSKSLVRVSLQPCPIQLHLPCFHRLRLTGGTASGITSTGLPALLASGLPLESLAELHAAIERTSGLPLPSQRPLTAKPSSRRRHRSGGGMVTTRLQMIGILFAGYVIPRLVVVSNIDMRLRRILSFGSQMATASFTCTPRDNLEEDLRSASPSPISRQPTACS